MESAQGKELNPFGRQPRPVTVTITGEHQSDVDYWFRSLSSRAEFAGDMAQELTSHPNDPRIERCFRIHPRAVND